MSKVTAGITMSLDGYTTGPNDRPGHGLGEGGEPLHYWVFGGPWTYQGEHRPGPTGVDQQFFDETMAQVGAVIGGRTTYWAAEAWGGRNPFGVPFFIVTHRPEDQPPGGEFTFVNGLEAALARAREAAGDRDVHIMGGADAIRQALQGGFLDGLSISIAPVVLGAGKPLFAGLDTSAVALEPIRVLHSPFVTHITYRVGRQRTTPADAA